jgi:hypothetical protein
MANRYTQSPKPEQSPVKLDKLLLDIMRDEFPDDLLYQNGQLTPQPNEELLQQVTLPEYTPANRNSKKVLTVTAKRTEHANYVLTKSVPNVDDETLDDLLDEEWNYFTDTPGTATDRESNLFLIHPRQALKPLDYHDAYLTKGPQLLGSTDTVDDIFCVYFIRNGVAYPIPNYKTLEVMLVERGLTYNNIQVASDTQLREFDLVMDGNTDIINNRVTPDAEFEARSLANRSSEWDYQIRYESGYRPREPFKRDPGDYFNPILRTYFDTVFRGQSFKESLRERFEGSMIVLSWPIGVASTTEFDNAVVRNDNSQLNDLVNSVRIMTNGYWKQVTDGPVFRAYAYRNNIDVSGYRDPNGRYGQQGYINLLVENGGITVLAAENITNDLQGDDVAWNAFPHIAEIDRMDSVEYEQYVDLYSGAPFANEYLRPYEPPGSVKYYDKNLLANLADQAAQQSQLDNVLDVINDKYEDLAALASDISVLIDSDNLKCLDRLSLTLNDLFQVPVSTDRWLFVKRKSNDLKVKTTENSLFRLIEKTQKITANLSRDDENLIAGKWSCVPIGNSDLEGNFINFNKFELPRDRNGRDRVAMKDDNYLIDSVITAFSHIEVNERYDGRDKFVTEAERLDETRYNASRQLATVVKTFEQLQERLRTSTTLEQFQSILNDLNEVEKACNIAQEVVDEIDDFNSNLDRVAKKYVANMYNSIQTLRKLVYERSGSGSKYGILWPASAITIMTKYLPGKIYNNYQPEA